VAPDEGQGGVTMTFSVTRGPPKADALSAQIAQFGVYPCRTDINDIDAHNGGSGACRIVERIT
jgi:hypothetical protein